MTDAELRMAIEVVKDRLFYVAASIQPQETRGERGGGNEAEKGKCPTPWDGKRQAHCVGHHRGCSAQSRAG